MAAGDVSITRGIGYRNDGLNASDWTVTTSIGPTATLTTDGDILTLSVTFNNNGVNSYGRAELTLPTSLATSTYLNAMIRHKEGTTASNPEPDIIVTYSPSTDDTRTLTRTTSFLVQTFALAGGNTATKIKFQLIDTVGTLVGTFTLNVDFTQLFKETLTLPAVSQPLQLSLPRYLVELPIPTREGGVLQDLGSQSTQLEISGTLVTTTTPNNYTGDQWWDVLVGTWLEANWQWLTSDRVSYKYQIQEFTAKQDPGRVGYYDFKLRLKKVDILSATAQTFNAIQ